MLLSWNSFAWVLPPPYPIYLKPTSRVFCPYRTFLSEPSLSLMPHLTFFLSYLPSLPHFPPIVPPTHPRISHLSSYPPPILQPLFHLIPPFFRKGLERGQEFAAAFPTLCERAPPPPPVVRRPVETADWSSHTLPTGQSSRGFHFRPWDNVALG